MRVGITGHRGLDARVEAEVRKMLRDEVRKHSADNLVGISCIADGPDAWFAESVLNHGGHIEVVIPASQYRDGLPEWHHPTYDALLSAASEIHRTGMDISDSNAHMTGSETLVGLAEQMLAVWDGLPARGYGGTADVVVYAQRNGVPVQVLWPHGATRG